MVRYGYTSYQGLRDVYYVDFISKAKRYLLKIIHLNIAGQHIIGIGR